MPTLPDAQQVTRALWEMIVLETAPGDLEKNIDLANEAAIQLIVEGGFDEQDSDIVFGGDMGDVTQTLLAAAFMLQPQIALRVLNLPDEDEPEPLGMTAEEFATAVHDEAKLTPIQQAARERLRSLGEDDAGECHQTVCRHCGLDIEGVVGEGEWRDRGNNRECPSQLLQGAPQKHEPVPTV